MEGYGPVPVTPGEAEPPGPFRPSDVAGCSARWCRRAHQKGTLWRGLTAGTCDTYGLIAIGEETVVRSAIDAASVVATGVSHGQHRHDIAPQGRLH